ncbi:hypothetical protein ABPG74_001441 [Tetrahymena malaccensis]
MKSFLLCDTSLSPFLVIISWILFFDYHLGNVFLEDGGIKFDNQRLAKNIVLIPHFLNFFPLICAFYIISCQHNYTQYWLQITIIVVGIFLITITSIERQNLYMIQSQSLLWKIYRFIVISSRILCFYMCIGNILQYHAAFSLLFLPYFIMQINNFVQIQLYVNFEDLLNQQSFDCFLNTIQEFSQSQINNIYFSLLSINDNKQITFTKNNSSFRLLIANRQNREQQSIVKIVQDYIIWMQKHKLDQQSLSTEGFQIMHTNRICHIYIQKILFKNLKYINFHNVYDPYGYTHIEGSEALRDGLEQFSNLIDFKLILEDINIGPRQMEIISEGIKCLKKLKTLVLDIYANSEIGELGCQGIGKALSNLVQLEELQIIIQKWNKIKSKGAIQIGQGIRNLKKLQKLNVQFGDDNFINMEGIKGFFEGVQDLNELKEFYFDYGKNNYIGEIGFCQFGQAIQNLKKLQKLEIIIDKNNKINSSGIAYIQKGFQESCENLVDLKLILNFDPDFNNKLIVELANCLKCLLNLKNLKLQINTEHNIEQSTGLELYRSICQLKKLQGIQLYLDKLFILEFVSLPQELKELEQNSFKLFSIRSIKYKRQKELTQNLSFIQDIKHIQQYQQYNLDNQSDVIEAIDAITELQVSIDNQNIQAEGIQSLTQALKRLTFLKILYIQILPNAIQAEGARNLAFSFFYLQNLQKLNLKISQSNKISEMGAKYIEQNLKHLINVVSFSFSLEANSQINNEEYAICDDKIIKYLNSKNIQYSIDDYEIQLGELNMQVFNLEISDCYVNKTLILNTNFSYEVNNIVLTNLISNQTSLIKIKSNNQIEFNNILVNNSAIIGNSNLIEIESKEDMLIDKLSCVDSRKLSLISNSMKINNLYIINNKRNQDSLNLYSKQDIFIENLYTEHIFQELSTISSNSSIQVKNIFSESNQISYFLSKSVLIENLILGIESFFFSSQGYQQNQFFQIKKISLMQGKTNMESLKLYFDHVSINLKIGHIKLDERNIIFTLSFVNNIQNITIDKFDLNVKDEKMILDIDFIISISGAQYVQISNLNFTSDSNVLQNNLIAFDNVKDIKIISFYVENILFESCLIKAINSDTFYLEDILVRNCFYKNNLISLEKINLATIYNSSFILDYNSSNFNYFQPLSRIDNSQKANKMEWLKAYNDIDDSRSLITMHNFISQFEQIINLNIENVFADFGGFDSRFISVYSSIRDLKINKCSFNNMKSHQNGGCLRFYVLNTLDISSSNFTYCKTDKFGGAIFAMIFQSIQFNDLNLENNSALFGGGIAIDQNDPQNIFQNLNFKNNTSAYFDNDLFNYKTYFQVSQIFEYIPNYFQQNYLLRNVSMSGQKINLIPGSIYVLLIDLNFFTNTNDSEKQKEQQLTTINNIFIGNLYDFYNPGKQQYSQQEINQFLNYELNLKEFKNNESYILFQPNSGLNQFEINFLYGIHLQSNLKLSSADCVQGQQKVQINSLDTQRYMCKYCENMSANYRSNLFECQQCDSQLFSQCYLNYTLLNQGYWRQSLQIDKRFIYKCQSTSQQSCIGGSGFGNELCSEGRIGNECSACDETSSYWNATYTSSSLYSCIKCNDIESNQIKICAGVISFIIILLLLIHSNFKKIQNQIYQHYLLKMQIVFIGTSFTKFGLASVFIKVLSFNASLLSFVQNQLEINIKNTLIEQSIQYTSPLQTSFISINCVLYDLFPNQQHYGIIKLKLYLIIPLLVIPLVLIFPLIRFIFKKSSKRFLKYNMSLTIIYTLFIVFYNQILSVCLDSLTCRSFGNGEKALQIDLAVDCSQAPSYYIFSLGGLVLYSILVPSYLIYSLISNRNKLNSIQTLFQYGFLYQEYKKIEEIKPLAAKSQINNDKYLICDEKIIEYLDSKNIQYNLDGYEIQLGELKFQEFNLEISDCHVNKTLVLNTNIGLEINDIALTNIVSDLASFIKIQSQNSTQFNNILVNNSVITGQQNLIEIVSKENILIHKLSCADSRNINLIGNSIKINNLYILSNYGYEDSLNLYSNSDIFIENMYSAHGYSYKYKIQSKSSIKVKNIFFESQDLSYFLSQSVLIEDLIIGTDHVFFSTFSDSAQLNQFYQIKQISLMHGKTHIKSLNVQFDHLCLNLKIDHIKLGQSNKKFFLSAVNIQNITINKFDLNIQGKKKVEFNDNIISIISAQNVQISNLNFTSASKVLKNSLFSFDDVKKIKIKSFYVENILFDSFLIKAITSDTFYLEDVRIKNCFYKTNLISLERINLAIIQNSSFILDYNSSNFNYFQPLSRIDKNQKIQKMEWLKAYESIDGSRSLIIMQKFENQLQFVNLNIENVFADFGGFDSRFISVYNSVKALKINKCSFHNMKSHQNGGCLRFYVLNTLEITSSNFTYCKSDKFGGAIFAMLFQSIHFNDLNLENNSALFGGGIAIDQNDPQNIFQNLNFKNNTSAYFDNDLFNYKTYFQVSQIFEYIPNYFQQNYLLRNVSITNQQINLIPGSIYVLLIDLNFFKNTNDSKKQKEQPTTINNIFIGNLYDFYNPGKQQYSQQDISQFLNYEINLKEFKNNESYILFQPNSGLNQFEIYFLYGINLLSNIKFSSSDCVQGQQKVQFNTLDTSKYMCKYCENMSANYRSNLFECQQCDSQLFSQCYLNYTLLNQGYWRQSLQIDKRFIYNFTKFGLASVFIKVLSFNASLLSFVQNQLEINIKNTLIEQSIQYTSPLQTSFISINCVLYDVFPNQQHYGIIKLKLYLIIPLIVIPLVLIFPLIRFIFKKSIFYNQILSVCLDSLTCRSFGNGEKALQIDLAVSCSQAHSYYIFSLGGLVLYSILHPNSIPIWISVLRIQKFSSRTSSS